MSDIVVMSNEARFDADVLNSAVPVAVYFYSEDCLPCMTFAEIFNRTAAAVNGQMKFVKMLRTQNRALSEKYSVKYSPTIMFFRDGKEVCTRLSGYISHLELKEAVEKVLEKPCSSERHSIVHCDVLITGAGPAGLTSAIYTSRGRLQTVVVESNLPGGQVATTFHVANYPGTNGVVRGLDLMENMKKQALDFGAHIDDLQHIIEVDLSGAEKFIKTENNDYYAKSVIIATGSEPRKLPVENERNYRGRGVHYCATCDGALYQDTDVAVVGGGESALAEAVFLSRYARSVTILNRSDHFKAVKTSIEEALKNPSISVKWNTVVKELRGENFLQSVMLEDVKTGEQSEFKADGVFVYIGTQPNSDIFSKQVDVTDHGYIRTDENMATNIPGVFAAGDVRDKVIRQISTAVGDGTIAGMMAERYINSLK